MWNWNKRQKKKSSIQKNEATYNIKTFHASAGNEQTEVSFELSYFDWLKLEQSEEWSNFLKSLSEIQNKQRKR